MLFFMSRIIHVFMTLFAFTMTQSAFAGGGLRCVGEPVGGLIPKVEVELNYRNARGVNKQKMNQLGSFSETIHRSGVKETLSTSLKEFVQNFKPDGSWPMGTYAGRDEKGNIGVLTVVGKTKFGTPNSQFEGTYTRSGSGLFMIVGVTCEILMGG
jgi:hypothetical protein